MDVDVPPSEQDTPATPSVEPYEMRITTHGKIHAFVAFALNFLKENPKRPLVLHTLPAPQKNVVETTDMVQTTDERADEDEPPPAKRQKLSQSTSVVSRLVSVVEIIKREFAVLVAAGTAGEGNETGTILHQYNFVGCLEDLSTALQSAAVRLEDETEALLAALEGKNHLKLKRTPYMKVTLCTTRLADLEAKGATYQCPPPPKKKSKGAKGRAKKRVEKEKLQEAVDDVILLL